MINTSQLTPKQVGKWVIYTDGVGETQRGKLKSWNENNVFVVFKCDGQWRRFQDFTGNSCNPRDLHFESKAEQRDNCIEHYYLPYGQYASGQKCQSCGDEIGTTF